MVDFRDRVFSQRKAPADVQLGNVVDVDLQTTKGALGQGFDRGLRGLKSGVYNFGGTLAEVAGAEEAAKQAYQEAQNQNQLGVLESPDVPRMSEVNDFASGARFVAGSIGQGVPYLGPSVGATLGTRLLGGSAAKAFAAGAGANFVPQAGAVQERLRADPVTAAMSPEKRAAIALGEGAVDSVINEIVPATIVNKSLSKTVTGRPLSNIAGDTSRAMVGEGAAEAGTEFLGQNVQTALNPNRDTSSDVEALKESFVAGGLGVAPFAVAGSTVANTAGRAAGEAEAAAQRSSNWVSSKLNKENTDIDTVLRPQRAPSGVDPDQWLSQDDALRNEAATRMAEYYSTAANVASRTKQAAQAYLSGSRVDDAWQSMTDAHQNEERIQAVRAGVDRFTAAVGRGVQGAKDALAARENAQTPMPDAFDSVLADRLFDMSKLSSEDSDTILDAMPRLTQGVRTWISNGFSEGGEVRIPDGLTDVFDDPAAAITDAYRLMVRQGLVKADDAKLAEVTDKLAVEAETRKASGSIIEDNLLPTAQNEYQFSGADHERLASELRTMIATGNIDEQALDTLFGPNKEIVLEALSSTTPKLKAGFETTDVAIDEINDVEDMVDGSDPVKQNEITENVKYLGPYTNTEAAIAKSKSDEETLRNANGQDVKRMGLTDALREQYDGRPEAFMQAMVDAVKKYTDAIRPAVEAGKRPEDALNEAITVLRAADASDKTEAIDVAPDTLRSVTPGSKNNVWAISPGKNNEYGDITRGALYFERSSTDKETGEIKPVLFATSASRLIKHARKAKTSGAEGAIEQAESLYAGIASMLNAQTADGKAATTGRVGYRMTPQSDITWMKQDERLPDGFVLPSGAKISDAFTIQTNDINNTDTEALQKWLDGKEKVKWTTQQENELARAQESGDKVQAKELLEAREFATQVDLVKKALASGDMAAIRKQLNKVVDDWGDVPGTKKGAGKSETEEMAEQAEKELNETPRIFDELTNEVVQPTPKAKAKTVEEIEARAKRDEQVKFTLDLLRKGMPAFNAALNKMSDTQKSGMRDVLNKMLGAKTQDNPIWGGSPPKDIEAFGNRARLALAKMGETTTDVVKAAATSDKETRVVKQELITRADLQNQPDVLFLFGDNDARAGLGGQAAAMRGEINAIGVRTKAKPSRDEQAYWSDATLEANKSKIDEDLAPAFAHTGKIVIPAAGLGTGLSELQARAPKTLAYLNEQLNKLGNDAKKTRVVLPKTSPYTAKDQAKSDKANKFIGRGSPSSSTAAYAIAWGDRANTGEYTSTDKVFVSVEGDRAGRQNADITEIRKALDAGATLITDDAANRNRKYNVGEQGLAKFLEKNGYIETKPGEWNKAAKKGTRENAQNVTNIQAKRAEKMKARVLEILGELNAEDYDALMNDTMARDPSYKELPSILKDGFKDWLRESYNAYDRETAMSPERQGETQIAYLTELAEAAPDDVEPTEQAIAIATLQGTTLKSIVRENAQTSYSEQSAFGSTEPALSKAEQDKIRADVVKRLGPDVAVEFAKQLFSSKSAAKEISGEWQEGILRISIRAQDPSGVAAHESMHEFFSRLNSSGIADAKKVVTILQNAANSAVVVRQLERLLADHPNALKQIDSKTTDHVEERLAYMYQFWQAGTLKIGPSTKSVFQNIADMFRSVIGKLSNDQKAEQILQAFDQGKTPTADMAAQVLAKDIEYRERQAKAALKVLDPVTEKLSRFILSAESSLVNSGNPHLQKILTEFKNPTGVGTLQSLIEAKAQKHAQFTNRLEKALGNVEKVDLEIAIKHLHDGTEPKDKVVLGIYTATKTILAEMETYMREAGVKRYDAEKKSWVPFGHVKNYFPRAYNIAEISKDAEGFVKDLMTHHMKELEAIAKQANEEVANGSKGPDGYASTIAKNMKQTAPIDAEQVATAIASRIINSYGHADLAENEDSIGYSPNARAINKRTLNWIDVSKFSKWMNNDLVDVMTSYIGQGTKRAEQVRRFGNNSEKLKASVDAAFEFEQNRIKEENPSMGKNEVEAEALKKMSGPVKDIMALEGTIGHDINPKLQRIQGTVLVYENLRTLGLSIFSQMIDPLGIMVRGGTMKETFATYTRGLKEVAASYKGTKIDDRASQIAEFLGTVDSAGFLANFGQAYSSMYLHQKARKWNEAFFKYNGMDGFNRAARIQATQAAISFIKRQKTDPSIHTKRYLDELVLAPDDIVIDANGDLNYEDPKIQIAVKRWVDQAILRPNAAHRPAWMSDPHFVLFSHMKQFSYTFHDTILKRAWLEAKNHGELGPIGVLLAGFVPMMVAADTAKALLLTGQEPYWMHGGLPSMIDHGVRRAGLLGLAQPYADPLMSGHEMSIAGPTVEQAVSVFTQPVETSLVDALPGASVINTIAGPTPDAS